MQRAGAALQRVEIDRDGKIVLVPGKAHEAPSKNPWLADEKR
jgi:hypothetical protein